MKKALNVTLLTCVLLTFVGCISIHNNKGASDNMPAATAVSPVYETITEIGNAPVSASVTGHSVLKLIKWGMPATFADNGSFGANSFAPALPIPVPFLNMLNIFTLQSHRFHA